MEAIIADLAARYPDGFWSLTRGGKRIVGARIYESKCGYTVNVFGRWHVYDHEGKLISSTHEHNWLGHVRTPRPKPEPAVQYRFKPAEREFIDRKIRQMT